MRRPSAPLVALLATALLALAAAGCGSGGAAAESAGPGGGYVRAHFPAPEFRLRDQRGHPVSSADLRGQAQVVTFLFPYCRTYCPLIARTLAVVQHRLAGSDLAGKARIVTFNVDPSGAGPAALRATIREFDGDPSAGSWLYLTGSPSAVRRAVTGGYHVSYEKLRGGETGPAHANPLADRRHVGYDVHHQDFVMIVGPEGKVHGLFDAGSRVRPAQILAALHEVL